MEDRPSHPQNLTPYFEPMTVMDRLAAVVPARTVRPGTGGPMPSIWDDLVMAMEAIVHGAEAMCT